MKEIRPKLFGSVWKQRNAGNVLLLVNIWWFWFRIEDNVMIILREVWKRLNAMQTIFRSSAAFRFSSFSLSESLRLKSFLLGGVDDGDGDVDGDGDYDDNDGGWDDDGGVHIPNDNSISRCHIFYIVLTITTVVTPLQRNMFTSPGDADRVPHGDCDDDDDGCVHTHQCCVLFVSLMVSITPTSLLLWLILSTCHFCFFCYICYLCSCLFVGRCQ